MKAIKNEVRKFKRANGIKGTPNLHELVDVIRRKYGYTSYGYHKDEEKLHETKTYEHSAERPAFTYCKDGKRYVFYNDTLSEKDITILLAHELGHLYYDHLYRHVDSDDTPIYKEQQAHIFAGYLLDSADYKAYSTKAVLSLTLALICFFCGTFCSKTPSQVISLPEETVITSAPVSPSTTTESIQDSQSYVYVAKTGTVYHIDQDCSYIKGNSSVRKMTLESAEDASLPLCSRCKSKIEK